MSLNTRHARLAALLAVVGPGLLAGLSDDDPAGSPTWSAWMPFFVADFTCRAAKFKLDLASGSATHNIAVSTLAIDIKVPA